MSKIIQVKSIIRRPDDSYECIIDLDFEDGYPVLTDTVYNARASDPAPVNKMLLQIIADLPGELEITPWPEPVSNSVSSNTA
jgi:hypothetical protein